MLACAGKRKCKGTKYLAITWQEAAIFLLFNRNLMVLVVLPPVSGVAACPEEEYEPRVDVFLHFF